MCNSLSDRSRWGFRRGPDAPLFEPVQIRPRDPRGIAARFDCEGDSRTPVTCTVTVVGTGVDPVTSRFSGANRGISGRSG